MKAFGKLKPVIIIKIRCSEYNLRVIADKAEYELTYKFDDKLLNEDSA